MQFMPTFPKPGAVPAAQMLMIPDVSERRQHLQVARCGDSYQTRIPIKCIQSEGDVDIFLNSEAFARLLSFIQLLNKHVKNIRNSDPSIIETETTRSLCSILDTLDTWIDAIPPLESPQRFGNRAFKTWIDKLTEETPRLLEPLLPSQHAHLTPELSYYFSHGFGNGTRIDYGSGHELSFVAFLCCLDLIECVTLSDYIPLVTRVFARYLTAVRRLQRVYLLEPAGSHGVWGLDDYQFLPYYWGSSQLLDHPRIKPKSICQPDLVSHFSSDYLYLGCIDFIHEMKKGPFFEHSPILYDISGVPFWHKVNSGMLKMYVNEVLKKFPVVQHLYFGALLPFEPAHEISHQ